MDAIIFTMGTRGDVQPYIFLAQALKEHGHRVTIGTHPCWKELVEESGTAFVPVGPEVDMEYEAARIRGQAKNPALSMLKTMQFVFKMIEGASGKILEQCQGRDLVIVSHSLMGATEAEVLGVKTVNVVLQTQMIPRVKRKKRLKDKIASALIDPQMVRPYNKVRVKYGLPKLKSMDQVMSGSVTLIPISRHVATGSPDWSDKNKLVGYWYREAPEAQLPEELQSFLSAGKPPVLLALGAMAFETGEERDKLELFVRALEQTGHRALIQGFNKTLGNYPLPPTMLRVGAVPHGALFPRCRAVIHHCGFGTAAMAMACGIPSVPVPHVLDQMGFAQDLYRLGVGTKPVPAAKLSVEAIAAALQELDANYEALRAKAVKLAVDIRAENGLETAVALIEAAQKE